MTGRTRVVVGLGNPGPRYEGTRHNIGFRLLDRLTGELGAGPVREEADYRWALSEGDDERVALLWPRTYMNRSGLAVVRFADRIGASPEDLLVAFDDVALPFGAIRFRLRGRAGGHRGLRSVIECLGTEEIPRLRLGVGDGEPGRDLAEYVLERFASDEEEQIGPWLTRAVDGVRVLLEEGPDAAMTRFNR